MCSRLYSIIIEFDFKNTECNHDYVIDEYELYSYRQIAITNVVLLGRFSQNKRVGNVHVSSKGEFYGEVISLLIIFYIELFYKTRCDFRRWLTKVNSQDISRLGVVRDPSHITKMHIRKKSLGPFRRYQPIVNIFKTLTRNFLLLVGFSQILC